MTGIQRRREERVCHLESIQWHRDSDLELCKMWGKTTVIHQKECTIALDPLTFFFLFLLKGK